MIDIKEMFGAHPVKMQNELNSIAGCIKACFDCAEFCLACADACLAEQNPAELARCIRLNQDCADICKLTATLMLRRAHTDWALMIKQAEVCERACKLCEDECTSHSKMHEHCRLCAEICHICKEACKDFMQEAANLA